MEFSIGLGVYLYILVNNSASTGVNPHFPESLCTYFSACALISLFHSSKSAQMVFTTHNTHLLDMTRFRKDQIFFVNKRDDSSSDLYSLFDYKDFREKMDLEKAYLQGRFDAVPYINEFENI